MAQIQVGTSGWSYNGWKGSFYPQDIRNRDLLGEYRRHFHTTEINNTFYSLPSLRAVRNWHDTVDDNFVFAVKASRYTTHNKKLKDPEKSTDKFFEAIKPLGSKCGPILFQLPPRWRVNPERLESFIKALPATHRYTFEFRNQSWLVDEVYEILEQHNVALCIYDFKGFRSPERLTADFAYVRLHGPEKAYAGSYDSRRLSAYARKFNDWKADGYDVYCYFDNDQKACAPHDARALLEKLTVFEQ